jgi:hypothetical protein
MATSTKLYGPKGNILGTPAMGLGADIMFITLMNRHFQVAFTGTTVSEIMEDDLFGRAICDSVEEPAVHKAVMQATGLSIPWARL